MVHGMQLDIQCILAGSIGCIIWYEPIMSVFLCFASDCIGGVYPISIYFTIFYWLKKEDYYVFLDKKVVIYIKSAYYLI